MPTDERHPPLSPREQVLFAGLADPRRQIDANDLRDGQLAARMLAAARAHGVLPIVWRKLSGLDADFGEPVRDALQAAGDMVATMAGQSLLLRHHGGTIAKAFAEAGIPVAIVKGPVFAERLYEHASDRPFTDIDLLTAPEELARANAILPSLGYVALTKQIWDKSESNQEYKWGRSDNPNLLIELHGDLVHYASFRRLLSYSYAELMLAGGGDPAAPSAMLMTAVIHGACGHKFHRLQFAVDILQAGRAVTDADLPLLQTASRAIGADLELAVSLNLAGRLFDDPQVLDLADRFSSGLAAGLSKRLVTPAAIHDAMSTSGALSHARRKAFRGLQLLSRLGRTKGPASLPAASR
ncbi:nucleotidyltransferase family protein [Mesorhizobium marinum]|uniref:nucleotidyltransferase family protein n=1 Tax=Mesorhizobium marinum TaxID=3228790 RepID=UPI003465CCB1